MDEMDNQFDSRIIESALKKGKAQKLEQDKLEYIRFHEKYKTIERGTIVIGKRIIPGYPHIKRIFTLQKGLERNIKDERVFIEEKIDGFNVRVVKIDDQLYAFSRGGLLDLFATEKIREMKLEKFFNDNENNKEAVLCGEMVGNTPHTEPTKQYDVKFLVFDIIRPDGFVDCKQKYEILNKYKIETVQRLEKGEIKTTDHSKIEKIIYNINDTGKEGIVIRGSKNREVVKYVTALSDIRDIEQCAKRFFDMPAGFFHQRIFRSAFFITDFDLDKKIYAEKLGSAFYKGLIEAVKDAKRERAISDGFEILIKDPRVWEDIKHKMTKSKEIWIEEISRKNEKGKIRIRFAKHYRKTSKILISYGHGKAIED